MPLHLFYFVDHFIKRLGDAAIQSFNLPGSEYSNDYLIQTLCVCPFSLFKVNQVLELVNNGLHGRGTRILCAKPTHLKNRIIQ